MKKDKIKRFIDCIVPVTACNLECHYCYVIQNDYRNNEIPKFNYTAEYIRKALNKKRLGGRCFFNICGAGETLLPKEVIAITKELLKEGHYINITTNGTLLNRYEEIAKFPKILLDRLHFSFSLHYIELKNKKLIDVFFKNIKLVKDAGASILVQFNMCDAYVPYLEEIKDLCLKHVGALPQIALTRDEMSDEIEIFSKLTQNEYLKLGNDFKSPLYLFTNKNFMQKQTEFCYAGDWSFRLDLTTGDVTRCYFEEYTQNWFKDINNHIRFSAVGHKCALPYCINSSHFLSLGNVPEIEAPTYGDLRNRKCLDKTYWQTKRMSKVLKTKLYESNIRYIEEKPLSFFEKLLSMRYGSGNDGRKIVFSIFGIRIKFNEFWRE